MWGFTGEVFKIYGLLLNFGGARPNLNLPGKKDSIDSKVGGQEDDFKSPSISGETVCPLCLYKRKIHPF